MAINTLDEKFSHEVGDIYDAEHRFLEGQQKMLQNASNPLLQTMIQEHITQTQQHIQNLDQVFSLLGQKPKRVACDAAQGLVSEGEKGMKESSANPQIRDTLIAGTADKVEHYEIASYRGLITGAELMGQSEIVTLLRRNLQQEEQTSQKIEQTMPQLLQAAMSVQQAGH
ncbi:MAG: ferritin-like domain-containing protein [Herpetosiphonaceae bacterium]|nr:ferritin-like domain-containing protein [Herpetosiphonaceae bacterium]